MKPHSRATPFQNTYFIEYGLRVVTRDVNTHKIQSVECLFCVYFGRTPSIPDTRQRKLTSRIKSWTAPWRAAEMAFGLFQTGNRPTPNRDLSVSVRSDCFYNIIDQFPSIMSVNPEHTSVPLGPNWSLIRSARFQSLRTPIQTDRKNPRIGLPGIYIQARSMRKKIHCKL